ncbi:MAG: hypothetical protein COU06_00970 [Candidatus Harrisonbacteria bacterium CG10_big_fil_rev_8_21_14_0_10_38_8]|uniref:HTH arsR-type domain-containing protein n=1 Tax=Candidatus Harrisonbacteria bacterium CG10_big_fil_rev_8_21_14_0_10_38_8 TaxID=1974582 RepID=A0A2M6WKI4_9BACT|nr:MAG: hypothetical protein COU06_00970 [Candidatus Harrisonbacteria bacterium CG10_big_fil_rev_8_21_14_0_10_38_8]
MQKSSYDINPELARTVIKILSNSNRYDLMNLLLSAKRDFCVNELSEKIGISQSATSHQLAYLEAYGVIRSIRMGKEKCYLPSNTPLTKKLAKVIKSLK